MNRFTAGDVVENECAGAIVCSACLSVVYLCDRYISALFVVIEATCLSRGPLFYLIKTTTEGEDQKKWGWDVLSNTNTDQTKKVTLRVNLMCIATYRSLYKAYLVKFCLL